MNGVSTIYKKPQPGKIGTQLWAIFDPAEDNNVSQRRNANGEVITILLGNTFAPISTNRRQRKGYSKFYCWDKRYSVGFTARRAGRTTGSDG